MKIHSVYEEIMRCRWPFETTSLHQFFFRKSKKCILLPKICDVMGYKKTFRFFLPLLHNRYSLSLILFFVWLVFFDSNNLIERTLHLRQLHQLEKDKIFYEEKIKEDNAKLEELESNPANLEKFAREQYLMKKDNEDIFIIDDN